MPRVLVVQAEPPRDGSRNGQSPVKSRKLSVDAG